MKIFSFKMLNGICSCEKDVHWSSEPSEEDSSSSPAGPAVTDGAFGTAVDVDSAVVALDDFAVAELDDDAEEEDDEDEDDEDDESSSVSDI